MKGEHVLIRAILFDLDGTLSLMDQDEFMRNYVGLLVPRFAHLLSPDRFGKQLLRSTEVMVREPKPGRTNLQTFFDDFGKATGQSFNALWPIFEKFYETDFPALRCLAKTNPEGKKAVLSAVKQGFVTAVASNPVMPLSAIKERIRWAELTPEDFSLIPSIEDFHSCKPHSSFFEELAGRLGMVPEECLMVGNHPVEDLAARQTGMKTFLVGIPAVGIETDYYGELADLVKLILHGNFA